MGKVLKTGMAQKRNKIKFFDSGETAGVTGPVTQVFGNRRATLDGCIGVIDYHENIIRLRVQNGTVTFCGRDLCMEELSDTSAQISGTVDSVGFEPEGKKCL